MANMRRLMPLRAACLLSAVLVASAGPMIAAPAAGASQPGAPTWGIVSMGESTATRDALTIEKMVLSIGFVGKQDITFKFEIENCCDETPPLFIDGQADACKTEGALPARTIECVITREIPESRDEEFSFRFPTSRPGQFGRPAIKATITVADLPLNGRIVAKRVKPESDFVVTSGPLPKGSVGETVEFEWSLANVGLDPVYERNGLVTLTAPPGTEFTGKEFTDEMPDISCLTAGATPTTRQCFFRVTEPGQAKAHKQKWPLKIVSEQVGEGKISASMSNVLGFHPEFDYTDPTPANNDAAIRVAAPQETEPVEEPVAQPGGEELPKTGLKTGALVAGGAGALLVGALLMLLVRRRRDV